MLTNARPAIASLPLLGLIAISFAQNAPPSARNLFNNKSSLALRCAVLKLTENGDFSEVLPNTVFHSGDEIRLSLTSNEHGFLYIAQEGSNGTWNLLYPTQDTSTNVIEAGERHSIPGGGPNDDPRDDFKFDEHPGEEHIFILLARRPEPDVDKVIQLVRENKEKGAIGASVVNNLLKEGSRDLVLTTIDDDGKEKALYAASAASPGSDDRVVVLMKLNHQ